MPTFALNFSRPGNQIAAQYYNFLRLGFDGYRRVQQCVARRRARFLADSIGAMDHFELITDGSELPVFAFTLEARDRRTTPSSTCRSACATAAGWCPRTASRRTARTSTRLRIVVRNGMSRDLADLLVADLQAPHHVLRQAHIAPARRRPARASATDMGRLDGKSVIVIGGAQGIGRGCVLAAAAEGARVVVGDINEAGAREVAAEASGHAARPRSDVRSTWWIASRSTRWSGSPSRSTGSSMAWSTSRTGTRAPCPSPSSRPTTWRVSCTSTSSGAWSRCRPCTRTCASAAGAS